MRGQVRRALPALILPPVLATLAFIAPGMSARSPRGTAASFLPVGSPSMVRTLPTAGGRRTPLTLDMLPHLFDDLAARAKRQGTQPDTCLTPLADASTELMPTWAPEPTLETIAFSSNGVDADTDGVIDPGPLPADTSYNIWLMRPDGSQQRRLTQFDDADEVDPSFDPGSRLVAFAMKPKAGGQYEIYTIEVATGVVSQITSSPPGSGDKRHPTWSADRALIGFQWKKPGQSWDIYTVPSSGAGSPTALITDPADDTSPAYHPVTATQLAFASTRVGGVDKIFLHDAGFATPLQLTNGGGNPAVRDRDPAWRVGGGMIAFSSDRVSSGADPYTDFNIWTVGSMGETGGAVPVLRTNRNEATDNRDDIQPAWSPFDLGTPPPNQPPGTPSIVQVIHASNRPTSVSDSTADYNIWSFTETDVTPCRLLALPWIGDPDLNQTNRLFTPGSDITIHAKVDDLESGVGRVFAKVKDPDGPTEDYLHVDHSFPNGYFVYGTLFNGTSFPGTAWPQYDYDVGSAAQVELFDDGDLAAHGDKTAGDGIFSGIITTNVTPSDYYIDILTTDQAGNFMQYDQVYGFSTLIFSPQNNILFVDDYGCGQLFPYTVFTQHWTAITDAIGYDLFNPSGVDAATLIPEYPNIWFHTFGTYDTWVVSIPAQVSQYLAEHVDVWRILARGPMPRSILDYYGPTTEAQLDPGDLTTERLVNVADRCVWWAAEHAGNIFPCKGVITDPDTQAELMRFLDRGGRLAICGEDVGWALTLDGQQVNPFYTGYLHANYVRDDYATGNIPFSLVLESTSDTPTGADDYVSVDPWSDTGNTHYVPTQGGISDGGPETGDNPSTLHTAAGAGWILPPLGVAVASDYGDGWAGTAFQDVVSPGPGAAICHQYGSSTGPAASIRYPRDPRANPGSYKTVYFAFGFANIAREYHNTNQVDHCRNYRGKLAHQTVCWLRTGTLTGHVLNIDGYQPIDPPPIIQVLGTGPTTPTENAVRALANGQYIINGILPTFHYIKATSPGFYDHLEFEWFHGGGKSFPRQMDFFITKAPNGSLSGKVTRLADGAPLGNIAMRAYDPLTDTYYPTAGPVPTNADGTYVIPDLPASDYEVTADGSAQLYSTDTQTVTVLAAQNTPNVDFQLTAADGFVDVYVTDADTGDPIANAVVHILDFDTASEITSGTTSAGIDVPPGETEERGHRTFQLGPTMDGYLVSVEAAGYQTLPTPQATGAVNPLDTTLVPIELNPVPGGSISGLITRPDGSPVGGVTVQVISGGIVIAGPVLSSGTITDVTLCNGLHVRYNYLVDGPPCGPEPGVPAGRHTVVATVSGLTVTPPSREAIVTTNEHTPNANFVVTPLHTFPAGLSMVSTPYDYSGLMPTPPFETPAEQLLGVQGVKMASYNPATTSYIFHPNAPTDAFRLGLGYWLLLDQRRDITTTAPTATDPYRIPLEPGWNIIGAPFDAETDYFSVTVEVPGGTVLSLPSAFAAGVLQSGIWTWVFSDYHTSLELAPWTGYWILAFQRCTLIVPKPVSGLAKRSAASEAELEPFRAPAKGWSIAIEARTADAQDSVNYLGVAADGSDGFDSKYDMYEPPKPMVSRGVSLGFIGDGALLAADIRAPFSRSASWDLVATCATPDTDVRVMWPDLRALPRDCTATLIDLDADVRVAMRTQQAYVFRTGQNGLSRRLRVQVSREANGRLTVTNFTVEPVRGGVQLAYTLNRDAAVDLAIVNIAGKTVRQLSRRDQRPAGRNAVQWDGRYDWGTQAPSGTYLCHLRAVTATGDRVESTCTVVVRR